MEKAQTQQRSTKADSNQKTRPNVTNATGRRDHLLHLQGMVGNHAVNRLIQAKLTISQPGDEYEREADQVAGTVMRMPEPAVTHVRVHTNSRAAETAAIQRAPEDDVEAEDEEKYRQEEREDKRRDKMKRRRGEAARAPTPEKVSGDAEKNINRMIKEAQESRQTGSGRVTDTPKQQALTNEFRRYLDQYRAAEMDQIDEKLKTTPKGPEREALVNQKRAIVNERVTFQYKFDEALRTPRGADAQGKYVRGAPAQPYHDIDDPRRGGYAQPDFTISKPTADGTVVVHVNLKSHDLRDIKAADARQIAKDVTNQAVSNVTGNQNKRGPQLGHLPPTDKLVISFIDMPPEEIRREMNAIILSKDSPIHEVRYGTVTETNPHIKALPKPGAGSSGGPDNSKLPKGSVFEQQGSPPHKPIVETTGHTSLPKESVFNIKPPDTPATPSVKPTSIQKGRVTLDFDPQAPPNKVVKRMRIDMSDLPPLPKSGGLGEMAPKMVHLALMGETLAGLYAEAVGGETQKDIEKIIDPIKSYFRGKLEDARVEFHTNYPDPTLLKQATGLAEFRAAYEKAMKGTQIGQAQRGWLALGIALSVGKVPEEDLKRMVEAYKNGQWAPTGAQLDALEIARQNYEDATYKVLLEIEHYDKNVLNGHADDIARRGNILFDAGRSLESTFWDLMSTVGMVPYVYYELWPIYDKASLFKEFGSGMYAFAGEIRQRAREYEQASTELNNTLIEVGETRFKGLWREPPK